MSAAVAGGLLALGCDGEPGVAGTLPLDVGGRGVAVWATGEVLPADVQAAVDSTVATATAARVTRRMCWSPSWCRHATRVTWSVGEILRGHHWAGLRQDVRVRAPDRFNHGG